jgi:hypothetical protein
MSSAFTIDQGVQAIRSATWPYLDHWAQERRADAAGVGAHQGDRPAFNALHRACQAALASFADEGAPAAPDAPRPPAVLFEALESIAPHSREYDALIWRLQLDAIEADELSFNTAWRAAIDRLKAFLRSISASKHVRLHQGTALQLVRQLHAASLALGSNDTGGAPMQIRGRTWVCFAADAWQQASGAEPTAGSGSPFWLAIEAFAAQGYGDATAIPRVGRKLVIAALEWRREYTAWLKEIAAIPPREID